MTTEIDQATDQTGGSSDWFYLLFASTDHKSVGRLWILGGLLSLIGITVLGVLSAVERASLGGFDIFNDLASYFQAWTLVRTGGIFMVVLPLFIGIATAVVPLQVGSPAIAFPRLAATAFWAWFAAAGVHIASFIADGGFGPDAGTDTDGTLLTLVSLGGMIVALLGASISIATTIIALRPEGMTLLRVPAFSWSMLVAVSVWLLSLPVLLANLILAWADLQGREPISFGNPDRIWADVEWAFLAPQVFAYAIPVLGVLAEVAPVSAKARQSQRSAILAFIGLFGALSFGAWAQHIFSRGADPAFPDGNLIYEEFLYGAFAVAIILPALAVLGGVLDTMRRGSMSLPGAALPASLLASLLVLAAAAIGIVRIVPGFDALHENRTLLSSATAQLMVIFAATIAAAVAALTHWAPKIFGGFASQPLAFLAALAAFGGGLAIGVADLVSAFESQPDISVIDNVGSTVETMNVIAVVGAGLLVVAALGLVGAVVSAIMSSEQLPDDPWEGHTLEWAAPSPPPVGNFVEPLEPVQSAEPLLDELVEVS